MLGMMVATAQASDHRDKMINALIRVKGKLLSERGAEVEAKGGGAANWPPYLQFCRQSDERDLGETGSGIWMEEIRIANWD